MDYRYKDTIAVPREYAITRNWLCKVKDQTIFVLGQEFLMFVLYWIACHVDMKILQPSMNNARTLPRRVKYKNLSDIWRSTLKIGAVQFAPIQNPLVPTLPSLFVNRSPIRYGFRAGTKAIWYTVDHPASRGFLLARFWCTLERVDFQCRVIFTCIKFTFANKI